MRTIAMPQDYAEALADLAKNSAPNESCALLTGKTEGQKSTIRDVIIANNTDKNPSTRFSIDSKELIECYRVAHNSGDDIVGIFHSHPNSGAYPSRTDIEYMTANPVAWLIYSVPDEIIKAYILDEAGTSKAIKIVLLS